MKKLKSWATNKEEFFVTLDDNHCYAITDTNELLSWHPMYDTPWDANGEEKPVLIEEFEINLGFPIILLKSFMAEEYPDINVDAQFKNYKKGFFKRFRKFSEKAYREFQEYKQNKLYEELCECLNELGYELEFK